MSGMRAGEGIELLKYPACPGAPPPAWNGWTEAGESAANLAGERAKDAQRSEGNAEFDARTEEETRRSFEAGRERGRQEGHELERKAQNAAQQGNDERRRQEFAGAMASFGEERDRYLGQVEQEVVKLALAVAGRILRREAQMDPLLLGGAVRIALGQLAGSTEVKLRVPAGELELWKETMAHVPNLTVKPLVIAGEGMRLGECAIESKVGSVDLGVRSQLAEIERGFFERASTDVTEASAARNPEWEAARE
jgi:flagellar assembly protein FliH